MEYEDLRARITGQCEDRSHGHKDQDYEHRSMQYEDFRSHCTCDRVQDVVAAANLRKLSVATACPHASMRERASMRHEDLLAQFAQQSRRLRWHESVRDWVSCTGQAACLHQAKAGTWPAWVVLDAKQLHTM